MLGPAAGARRRPRGRVQADGRGPRRPRPGDAAGADRQPRSTRRNAAAGPRRPVSVFRANVAAALRGRRPRPSAMIQRVVARATCSTRCRSTSGSLYVNDFNLFGRTWQVIVQADAAVPRPGRGRAPAEGPQRPRADGAARHGRGRPARSTARWSSPATTCTRRRRSTARRRPASARARRSSSWSGSPTQELPATMAYEWTELTYLELQAGNTAMIVFGFAVVMVFLVLAAQYESWSLPLAVILVVPMCLLSSIVGVHIAEHGHQHLHADRLRGAGRPGQQERDPDRRVRQAAPRRGRGPPARRRWRPAGCGCGRS